MDSISFKNTDLGDYGLWNLDGSFYHGVIIKTIKDANDKVTYREYEDGYWKKYVYDSNGNEIFTVDSNDMSETTRYDKNGNVIYEESIAGWNKYEYDEKGNRVKAEYSDGRLEFFKYDERNNCIRKEFDDEYIEYDYDENNNMINVRYSDGININISYDEHGMMKTEYIRKDKEKNFTYKNIEEIEMLY